ncbi:hypothetical protein BKA70DRAFT_1398241 [Coprinopsis sp. MPI-PUGE-AT-0042]|nr:hypothetical protein BKA70DRAFT_1398241 [Coprinopsis sp. MPI-PUGE-AT-0042]
MTGSQQRSNAFAMDGSVHWTLSKDLIPFHANGCSPINRLPVELLGLIFHHYQSEFSALFPDSYARLQELYQRWIGVTLVCKHWYATARHFSTLWTHLCNPQYPSSIPYPSEGIHPLSIYHTFDIRTSELKQLHLPQVPLCGTAEPMISRIHMNGCYIPGTLLFEMPIFNSPAPALESLALDISPLNFRAQTPPTAQVTPPIVPNSLAPTTLPLLFDGHAPLLKKLQVHYVTHFSNSFTNLAHLSLFYQSSVNRMSLVEFLGFLEGSKETLEVLVLVGAGPTMKNADGSSLDVSKGIEGGRLSLPKLRILELSAFDTTRNPLHLLPAFLDVPSSCVIAVAPWKLSDQDRADFLSGRSSPSLPTHTDDLTAVIPRKLCITQHPSQPDFDGLVASDRLVTLVLPQSSHFGTTASIGQASSSKLRPKPKDAVFTEALKPMLQGIQELNVEEGVVFGQEEWPVICGCLPSLERLYLGGDEALGYDVRRVVQVLGRAIKVHERAPTPASEQGFRFTPRDLR